MPVPSIPIVDPYSPSDPAGTPYGAVTQANWDFDREIQDHLDSGNFASSKSTLICAAPAFIPGGDTDENGQITGSPDLSSSVHPIGLTQDFSLSQQRGINEVPEIGSNTLYYVMGTTSRQFTLSRVMFHGPSLLRALYSMNGTVTFSDISDGKGYEELPASSELSLLYVNLASRFFEKPTGLLIRMSTPGETNKITAGAVSNPSFGNIGGIYLEECYVRMHSMNTNANNSIIAENVSMTAKRVMPIKGKEGGTGSAGTT